MLQSAQPLLDVAHLTVAHNGRTILDNVSFALGRGEIISVIGPNGGGKTTLLKLLMGFLTPDRGSIQIAGVAPVEARHLIGYVPQSLHYDRLFPISTLELVLMGRLARLPWYGRYSRDDHAQAMEMLEKVGVANFAHHQFGSLSGGQRQRALIARALVSDPKILLLDEPTASVDPEAAHEIDSLILTLKGDKTILRVTHHLRSVVEGIDSILCVEKAVSRLSPQKVCEHFAIGLYHSPLLKEDETGATEKGSEDCSC